MQHTFLDHIALDQGAANGEGEETLSARRKRNDLARVGEG